MSTHGVTADLVHAVQVRLQARLRAGRHIIPLDKDGRRPQFWFDSEPGGHDAAAAPADGHDGGGHDGGGAAAPPRKRPGATVSASLTVGSERLSPDEDLDPTRATPSRSRPVVKGATLVFEPPLRLGNVAPTLLHFPNLFEDRALPKLRRMQAVGFLVEFLASLWFLLEKILWALERRCQVRLGRVTATPLFRGSLANGTAQWRLGLCFTGHLLLFDWIPIPFISFRLPSFIIPQV